jgi:NAD+ kinase
MCQTWVADSTHDAPVADLYVSLGGDGTFLRAAHCAHLNGGVVLGVDLGRVGFLLRVAPHDILSAIRDSLRAAAPRVERLAIRGSWPGGEHVALNELVVERAQTGRMVHLRVRLDGEEFMTYHADGVLVATPTGSTAYNFSAGGPVIATDVQAIVVTPLAPHFTIDRSAVVNARTVIDIELVNGPAMVVADGEVVGQLEPGQHIAIHRDPRAVVVADDAPRDLGSRLRHHLREGHA